MKPRTESRDLADRFQPRNRHYHHVHATDEVSWDEWTGQKKKSEFRKKFDKACLNFAVMATGISILGLVFLVLAKLFNIFFK